MYNLGIDLGGTGIKTGVVNEGYQIIGYGTAETKIPRPGDDIMDDIAKACREAVANAGLTMDDIEHVGIGTPGTANSFTGILEFAGNLGLSNYPMVDALTQRLGKKVYMENDANAAAFGEAIAGAAKGVMNAVCITLGTGVGAGVIIDGKIFAGANYAGTEIGHTVIMVDGDQCTCGRRGCWERYASATALISQAKAAMMADRDSAMWDIVGGDIDKVNGKTPFDAMHMGDKSGTAVVEQYIRYVACGVVNVVNVFQPDVLCIGGGVSKQGDTLLAPIQTILETERFSRYSIKQTKLVTATLGNDAGIVGAANLYAGGLK
ncbi:MAG: ROK family protein [Ruminococcaceae bacterium]|nr:ROK family protein [Oscillospiraceae bacterium]